MRDYHHTKFGLIWVKESKVTEGGRNPFPPGENVLNRPGEIGLIKKTGKAGNKNYESPLKTPFYQSIHLFEGHCSK